MRNVGGEVARSLLPEAVAPGPVHVPVSRSPDLPISQVKIVSAKGFEPMTSAV